MTEFIHPISKGIPPLRRAHFEKGYERMKKAIYGERVDRVPNVIWSHGAPARFFGRTLGQAMSDFKFCVDVTFAAYAAWGWDFPLMIVSNAFDIHGAPDIGARMNRPADSWPALADPACKTPEDVDNYEVPDLDTMLKRGVMSDIIDAHRYMKAVYGFEPVFAGYAASPVVLGALVSHENFLRWMVTDPRLAKKVNEIGYKIESERLAYMIRETDPTPPGLVFLTDFADEVMSPEQWEEYVLPAYRVFARVAKEYGCECFLHECGDHRLVFEKGLLDKVPNVRVMHIASEVDIEKVVERFGNKCCVYGNLSIEHYRFGTAMDAYNEAKRQIEIGKRSEKGFWLGVECDFAADTPPGHAFAISRAVEDYGWY